MKLLEGKRGMSLHDPGIGKGFLDVTLKSQKKTQVKWISPKLILCAL